MLEFIVVAGLIFNIPGERQFETKFKAEMSKPFDTIEECTAHYRDYMIDNLDVVASRTTFATGYYVSPEMITPYAECLRPTEENRKFARELNECLNPTTPIPEGTIRLERKC